MNDRNLIDAFGLKSSPIKIDIQQSCGENKNSQQTKRAVLQSIDDTNT